jgi:hypothetical protein
MISDVCGCAGLVIGAVEHFPESAKLYAKAKSVGLLSI